MPDAVAAFLSRSKEIAIRGIQDNIIASYADDFSEYAKKNVILRLHSVYRQLPRSSGVKVKYASVLPNVKTANVKHAIDLLAMAGVIQRVFNTNCSGIPLCEKQ